MAEVNYQSFSLDIDKAASKNLNQVITGRLGDNLLTGVIVSTLENDKKFDLTGYSIRFEGTTHDGTIVVDADNVEIVSLKEGTFKYTFSNKVFSVLDQYQTAYFAFEKADRRATTENFIISVIEDVDVTWEEAQSYISILNALIRKFNTEWDEFKADKTKTFDDFIKTKETQYQQLSDTAKQLGIDFAELQSLVTQLQKDVSAMETKATQLSKDLTALDSKSKAVSTAFDTTKKNVDTLDVTVADLAKRSTDLKTETTNLESRVSTLKTDTTSLEQRTEDIQQVQSELAADVTEVSKAIEENDVYRKAETFNQQQDGVNVLDTITGTKPTLYSETLLADGEQGTGSIFVKDLPYGANYAIGTGTSKTLTGDGSKQATNNNLYTLSDKLLGKKVTVSVEVEKSAGATGEGVIIAIKNTWQQLFSFKVADIPAGSKKKLTTTTTIRTDDNIQALYMQSQPNNSTNHLNGTITVSNFKIELGDTATPWCPASEDYGIVHGQPNIFTGAASSSEWRTLTFGGYYHNDLAQRYIVGKDINVGDTISSSIEIDNSLENSVTYLTSQATVIKNDSSAPTYPESGTYVNVGESKTITLSYKVQSNDAEINMKLAMKNPQESTTFRYRNAQIIKGDVSLLAEGWKPAQQNSGLTPHNPKILSESRNLFSAENATLGYFQGWSYKSDLEANANRACSVKIPVTASKVYSVYSPILTGKANFIVLACYDSQDNKTHMYRTDKWIVPDATHTSSASYRPIVVTIPAGTAYVRLAVDSNGGAMTRDKLVGYNLKLIEGDFTKNAGMVPFSSDQYAALADPLKYVRAETLQVGRGAELQFDFPVIAELEKRHPHLFENTNSAEKTDKYLSILKSVKLVASSRGGGLNSTNTANSMRYYLLHLETVYANTWLLSTGAPDATQFQTKTVTFTGTYPRQIVEGGYKIYVSSRKNGNPDVGAITDGIIPAWVEVRDIALTVELEINGKTVVEEIAAEAAKSPIADFAGSGITQTNTLDFQGKVSGSHVVKPHWIGVQYANDLQVPSLFKTEVVQSRYNAVSKLDNDTLSSYSSAGTADQFPAALIRWNIIEDFKRRYTSVFEAYGAVDLASQIAVMKKIIAGCKYSVWGRGVTPAGNKLNTAYWLDDTVYSTQKPFNATNEIREITYPLDQANAIRTIDKDGFVNILVYPDKSTAVVSSALYIDYACLEYTINLKLSDIIDARIAKQTALLNQAIARIEQLEGGN